MIDFLGIITRILLAAPGATAGTPAKPAPAPVVAAQPATKAPTAVEVVNQVQAFYAGITQVTAQFRQTVKNSTFGTDKVSNGKLYLLKPGKMRWDYVQKKKQSTVNEKTFLSDGKTLYVIEHDNKQIMKKNLDKDLMPVAVTFLYGKGDLKTEFTPALDTSGTYGEKTDIVLKLTPKAPSAQYKSLTLVVSPKDFHVTQSIIVDSSNNVNHFRFYAPDFKTVIDASKFAFDPKNKNLKNYRIIDADQPQTAKPGTTPAAPAKPAVAPKAATK